MPKLASDQASDLASFAPSRVLRVFGMRRSGNHAIINWLQRNTPDGNSVFLNNCHPRKNPLESFKSVEVYADGRQCSFAAGTTLPQQFAAAGAGAVSIVSCEDAMPPKVGAPFSPLTRLKDVAETVVIIYRSFLNWSASLLRKLSGNSAWGSLARARIMTSACSGYVTALERVTEAKARGFVGICYDEWHASDGYRTRILKALGFAARDNSLGPVQRYGGGSSFQGKAKDASALQTDQRAQQMADNPEYQTLLWTVAHDDTFMQRLAVHFPEDARKLLRLAETAEIRMVLPQEVSAG